jgi:hypothetical protein
MPETREKVYHTEDEHVRDEADAVAHGWSVIRREPLPNGSLRVLYEHPERSQWAAPEQASQRTASARRSDLNLAAATVAVGGLMIAAGAFLPWATVVGLSVSGTEGSDGWIVLALGAVLSFIGLRNLRSAGSATATAAGVLVGLVAAGVGIWKYASVKDIGGGDVLASALVQVGAGVYLIIVGGLIGALASLAVRRR